MLTTSIRHRKLSGQVFLKPVAVLAAARSSLLRVRREMPPQIGSPKMGLNSLTGSAALHFTLNQHKGIMSGSLLTEGRYWVHKSGTSRREGRGEDSACD
jgi:hypothetical protein